MKLNLNESLKSYDAFLNEREAQAEATADSRDAMIADVDTIITSLETLATAVTELKEDWTKEWELKKLNEDADHPLNETMLGRWIKAKMLAKKQKKINVMKLKASDMATAANQLQGAENRDKKAYMMDKKKQLEDNVKELQAMVNDKANEIGGIAPKVINKVKMQGAIEVIKSQIGNVDPDQAKTLKQRLNDLKTKAAEEDEAIADFKAKAEAEAEDEKGDDKTQALKDQLSKLKDEKKGMPKETDQDKLALIQKDMEIANLNAKIKAEDGDPNTDPSEDDAKLADLKKKAEELQAKIDGGGGEENKSSQELADEFIAKNDGFKTISAEEKSATVKVKNEETGEEEDKPKYEGTKEFKGKKEDGSDDEPIIVAKEIDYSAQKQTGGEDNKTSQELADEFTKGNEGFKVISAEDKAATVEVEGEEEPQPKYGDFKEFKGKKEDGSDDEPIIVAKEIDYSKQSGGGEDNKTSQQLADEFTKGNEGFKVISAEDKAATVKVKNEETGEEEDKPKYGDFKEFKGKKEDGSDDEPIIVAKEIQYAQNNSLVIRANAAGLNELAKEIATKLDWQLAEGTGLRLKYEAAIRKAESDKTLNENRYFDNNMKDAFRRLL